ncbi:MAG: hypothetical protein H6Q14_1164 [Bacteroidetes bacterium]|nr:hypothetical protein [Bacteroidota bacterium]MBP1617337.1 hypothetical protein [Bacteroidota bacterium]
MKSNSNSLVKNVASLSLVQIASYVFPLLTVPYISRIIGPEGYGIINYASAFIGYFALFIAYGFDLTATRKVALHANDPKAISRIFSEVITARTLLLFFSIILFAICLLLLKPLQDNYFISIVLFVGCISSVISTQFIYQGLQKLVIFSKINFIRGTANVVLIFALIKQDEDYYWLPVLSSGFVVTINVFLVWWAKRKFNLRFSFIKPKEALSILLDERMVFFSTVMITLYTSTNTVILGFFVSKTEVGYYTTSQAFLGIVISVLTIPFATAFFPYVGQSFGVSRENGLEMIKKIFPIVSYLTLAASLIVFICAPFVITIIYGHKFDPAIPALRITAFLPFIISMSNILGIQTMLNLKMDKLFFKTTFVASVFGVILNLFMSMHWGYIGTAWNCIIIESFVTVIMYFTLRKNQVDIVTWKYFSPGYMKFVIIHMILKK